MKFIAVEKYKNKKIMKLIDLIMKLDFFFNYIENKH